MEKTYEVNYEDFDVIEVDKWEVPEGGGAPILTMPNIPYPLHNLAPRTVLGARTWDFMRRACYSNANDTCEVCGYCPEDKHERQAHELYEIDYANQKAKFIRTICLCSKCHLMCIHTGRALTLCKKTNPLYKPEQLLDGAEHAFRIINEYNTTHDDEEPLRAFSAWLDYMRYEDLREPMLELIEKYDMKFYKVSERWYNKNRWPKWMLNIANKNYPTKFPDKAAWQAAMEENNKKQWGGNGVMVDVLKNDAGDELEKLRKELGC